MKEKFGCELCHPERLPPVLRCSSCYLNRVAHILARAVELRRMIDTQKMVNDFQLKVLFSGTLAFGGQKLLTLNLQS